jgi:O-antigen/teichoic acid export membrane protein
MSGTSSKASFFKQGGWMVVATVGGGVFMSAVHPLVSKMPPEEYAIFYSLLRVFLLLGIPAGGLQTIFAQQAAASLDDRQARQLTGATRAVLRASFLIWLVLASFILMARSSIMDALQITHFAALGFTVLLGLPSLWMPVFKGLLQGRQNFAGLGWVLMLDGICRFGSIAVLVVILHGQSGSAMAGAFIGQVVAIIVGLWLTRDVWRGSCEPIEWRPWFRKVIPLTLGTAALLFMSNADVLFVQNAIRNETALYSAGAMIGFALAQFILPLATVMFPKIVHSAARAEKSDALAMTLKSTALLGGLAALASTLLPELPLRILYFRNPAYFVTAAPLVPWFAWGILILSMAYVLVTNLLAREKFAIVPWLVVIALAYGATLYGVRESLVHMEPLIAFRRVIQILSVYSAVILLVSMRFTWPRKQQP